MPKNKPKITFYKSDQPVPLEELPRVVRRIREFLDNRLGEYQVVLTVDLARELGYRNQGSLSLFLPHPALADYRMTMPQSRKLMWGAPATIRWVKKQNEKENGNG